MDILDKFISAAHENIKSGYYLQKPKAKANFPKASLRRALEGGFALISEIKHASPAGEYSFDNIDAAATAKIFKQAGADAISVVVEPQIFKGALQNIPEAKSSGLPVLFKDFVLSEEQIIAARDFGADCVLLVATALERTGIDQKPLIEKAHSLGLEVLLECYNAREFEDALSSKADVLGINNRDLKTLKVDLNRTKNILEEFKGKITKPVISESGVRVRSDSEFLRSCGASGILVGTALWKAPDIGAKVVELRLK